MHGVMSSRSASLLVAFALLACASASCGRGGDSAHDTSNPRRVRSFGGVEANFPQSPRRIVPGSAAATSLVVALVEPERIAAIPTHAFAYSAAPLEREDWSGRLFGEFVGEDLLRFDPDVVVTDEIQSNETKAVLVGAGVALLTVPDASTFAELIEIVSVLGRVLDAEERARELIDDLEHRRAALAGRVPAGLRVLSYTNYGSGGFCAGRDTTAELLLALAGVDNAAAERAGHTPVSYEELYALDPDVLLVGSNEGSEVESSTASFLRSEADLAALRAVREDRIVVLPSRLFTANSHYLVDAAEQLVTALERLAAD